MKTFLLSFTILLFIPFSTIYAQSTLGVNLGPDDTLCDANLVNVSASFSAIGVDALIPSDDVYSDVIDITFPFTFYGNVYNQCLLSTNSYITFDLTGALGGSPWSYTASCPDPALPTNSIFGVYQDLLPAIPGGNVSYGVLGTAPNRVFVYSTCNVPLFSCTSDHASNQIMLYEGSNNIEVHVGYRVPCTGWNNGNGLIGIQDISGTNGISPIARNTGPWTAMSEAWRFTPTSGSTYSISSIPFAPLPILPANGVYFYVDGVFAGSGTSIDVMVTDTVQVIAVADTLSNLECGFTDSIIRTMKLSDTMYLYYGAFDYSATSTAAACLNSQNGVIQLEAEGAFSSGFYNFIWEDTSGIVRNTVRNTEPAYDSLTSLGAGRYWYTITNGICSIRDSLLLGSILYYASFTHKTEPYCVGEMISFRNTSTGSYSDLIYDYGDGTIDSFPNPFHAYTTPGTYTVKLIIYTYTGCTDTAKATIFVGESPKVDLRSDTTICDYHSIILDAGTDYDSLYWQDGSTNQMYTVTTSGKYIATVSNGCGIVADSVTIDVEVCDCNLVYPDAFTPNGDNKNDTYSPLYICNGLSAYNMRIFNRWGNLVYETNDINAGWNGKFNGKDQPIGTYVYHIKATSSKPEKKIEVNGVLNLIR